MAALCEALGVALPHNAAHPGRRREAVRRWPTSPATASSSWSATTCRCRSSSRPPPSPTPSAPTRRIGGSTNAVVHLLALAGRAGVPLTLDDWDRLGRDVPCIVNLKPSGTFLMEDFHDAGGFPAVLRELIEAGLLDGDAPTVTGRTLAENCAHAPNCGRDVIRSLDRPVQPQGGIAVLRGNLAPDGAVIKPSAATPALLRHRGRAVVFESIEHYHARIDDPALEVDADLGPGPEGLRAQGLSGHAGIGNMGLPPKLLRQGVTDMVRISDARMSGTAYGTVVLHVAPEAAAGGPLALVQDGDEIELDVPRAGWSFWSTPAELAAAPGRMDAAAAGEPARLCPAVPRPCHAGGQGLRLRLPGRRAHQPRASRGVLSKIITGRKRQDAASARDRCRRHLHRLRRLRRRGTADRGLEGAVGAGRSGGRHPERARRAIPTGPTVDNIRLGTTVATNAMLERKGAVVAYVDHQGLPRRAVHPARQPQVPLRHELGQAEAAGQAPPLLRARRAHRRLRRGRRARSTRPRCGAVGGARSAAQPEIAGGRRLPAVLLPRTRRTSRRVEGDPAPRSCRACRSRSPTRSCRSGRNTSAPRPRSPTPTSSRWSAASCARCAGGSTRARLAAHTVVIKSNGGEMTLEAAADAPDPDAGLRPDRRRDREPARGRAHRHRPPGHARHGRHLDRRLDRASAARRRSPPRSRSNGACRSRSR